MTLNLQRDCSIWSILGDSFYLLITAANKTFFYTKLFGDFMTVFVGAAAEVWKNTDFLVLLK